MKRPLNTKLQFLLLSATALVFAAGCGKKNDSAADDVTKRAQTANDVAKAVNDAVAGATGNAAHKSSAHAIASETLANLLPNISGYTAEEPKKASMNYNGVEWSSAERTYTNGDKSFKVTYADYNYITGLTSAYSMLMNFSMEDENEIQKSEKFGNYPGWINWKKKANDGQVGIVVNDRVFVVVEAKQGLTLDDLRSIVNQLNLDGIAKAST